jgi:hypothetical protein
MVIEFTTTEHNGDIDEATFRRPEQALPITAAPLYKEYKEAEVTVAAMEACVGVYQHPEKVSLTATSVR